MSLQLTHLFIHFYDQFILQSAADYEIRETSLGSVHSRLQVDEPGLKQRSASVVTVLTAAAMEGTVPLKIETSY